MEATQIVNAIVYVVPVAALIVSILTFTKASSERHERSAAESANIAAELKFNTEMLRDIKSDLKEARDSNNENRTRIIAVEGHMKDVEHRLEVVEDEVKKLRNA